MYNINLEGYVPVPHPATSDRIVAAHYYPAWQKGKAGFHRGFDDLHEFPERTPLLGYYDGDSPELCDWEIKWALEHGINCFIYCWYRWRDNMGKPLTKASLRLGEALHDGFFNARYSDMMSFAIMFEAQRDWGGTDKDDLIDNLMPFWIENYFSKDNYLKIDGKPVLFVYDGHDQIKNALGTPEEQSRAFDACRDMARDAGYSGMIFAVEYRADDLAPIEDYRARGYDFSFAYCYRVKDKDLTNEHVIREQVRKTALRAEEIPDFFCPTACAMWDPSPRFITMPDRFTYERHSPLWTLSPEEFRRVIREMVNVVDVLPEDSYARRILMLDNWNEWDEGHYIMPSHEFGFGYLQAVREELTVRDNLPDYRLPQDIRPVNGINKSWDAPDLSEICRRKFDIR